MPAFLCFTGIFEAAGISRKKTGISVFIFISGTLASRSLFLKNPGKPFDKAVFCPGAPEGSGSF